MKFIFSTLCLLFLAHAVYAADVMNPNPAQIQTTIQTIQNDLAQQRDLRTQLTQNLQQSQAQFNHITHQYQKLLTQQKAQLANLKNLQQQQQIYEDELTAKRKWLNQQLRFIYLLQGQQTYLPLLLSQDHPPAMSLYLGYSGYLIRNQVSKMRELTYLMQKTAANNHTMQEQEKKIAMLQQQQTQQLNNIKSQQAQHQKSLDLVSQAIQDRNEKLGQLLADNAALENVVQEVAKANMNTSEAESTQPPASDYEAFSLLKGRLNWPVHGRIIARFNSDIDQSGIKLPGVLLSASDGQDVHAVASGKVAFADEMSGYGLLMIVDHGEGYMTLYGRNGSLYKQVGEKVQAGERIATVGSADNYAEAGLYFAIRKNGNPLNPQVWCR